MVGENQTTIVAEANRIHESAMLSAQTQFEYSKSWRSIDRWVGGSAAAFAAVAATGGLSEVFTARKTGLIAFAAAALGAIATSLGAPKAKDRAHASANALLALQQDARIFMNIEMPLLSDEDAREQLRSLVTRQQELNATAEIPSRRAWRKSQKNIKDGRQNYEVDK
jgi:hypothetical protein